MTLLETTPYGARAITSSPAPAGHWISVVTHLDPSYGGLSAVVPQLGFAMASSGSFNISVAAFCGPDEDSSAVIRFELPLTQWPISRGSWIKDRSLRRRFSDLLEQADGLHIHGLWEQSTLIAARAARARKLPYVLSAHGMLDRWALASKPLKKMAYSALFERANVNGASCLHALTRTEAEDYRRCGARQPIAIIPNGVSIPAGVLREEFFDRYPGLRDKRIVLFLGRIHPKKGLDLLANAWPAIASHYPEAHLVLAGPDSEGTQAKLSQVLTQAGVEASVTFTGMLSSDMKWSALSAAECFVLPSYSEGLSVASLEAMAAGLPVILTYNCNLPEVAEREAGWTISPDAAELQQALLDLLSSPPGSNRAKGERGRALVRQRYSWDIVARQFSEVYAWLQGGNSPVHVEILSDEGAR